MHILTGLARFISRKRTMMTFIMEKAQPILISMDPLEFFLNKPLQGVMLNKPTTAFFGFPLPFVTNL
jgi:hypothetical protein